MKTFINDDFLLHSRMAGNLYYKYAQKAPVFDFHCHLNPKDILEDRNFSSLTEIWLAEDHYKWRLMRANGIEEQYVTGNAGSYEKFLKLAETVPKCLGNPIYHWTHLELKRYFGVDELLTPETAPEIWKTCNEKLSGKEFSVRSLIRRSNVRALCTTDDPIDDLSCHFELLKDKTFDIKVLPTFRPEKALNIESETFIDYIARLGKASGINIASFEEIVAALKNRAEFFKKAGCLISDVSVSAPDFARGTPEEARSALKKALAEERPSDSETNAYKRQLMLALGRIYKNLGLCMQLHVGVLRNVNSRLYKITGPDGGFDTVGDSISAQSLVAFLNELDTTDELPKTVIYNLDGKEYLKIASIIGCFQQGGCPGKLQLGTAWWFNDHIDGMRMQMKTLANVGLLSRFIGMLTDSRSFLSYTRHEYFRRILCDLIGGWAEDGLIPYDEQLLGQMAEDISFNNAVEYFGLKL